MDTETWKAFGENPVTHSVAHHLVAIEELHASHGYARVSDVARQLGITRGSASLTLKGLKQRGLVVEDDNRFISLSSSGRELVQGIRAKRAVLEQFMVHVLRMPPAAAVTDTCKIEHLVSKEMAAGLLRLTHCFSASGSAADVLRKVWAEARASCPGRIDQCQFCDETCLEAVLRDTSEKREEGMRS